MKNIKNILLTIFTLFLTINCYSAKPTNGPNSLAPMLEKAMPAIVNIAVRGNTPIHLLQNRNLNLPPRFEGQGSGVIIDAKNGYIVTNSHVVQIAQDTLSITITLSDGRSMVAKMIGYDIQSDIAVLQIKAKRLTSIPFGDSDNLKVGDFVCTIGSPFGLQQTVTSGVISALERSGFMEGPENLIQTDAPINPGNSGGALANMQGKLIGINTAGIAPIPMSSGIGLAVPSNTVKSVAEQLIKHGKVTRGIMGVMVQDITGIW